MGRLQWCYRMIRLDFETYSEAGFLWDEATSKWAAPTGAGSKRKGLPTVGARAYIEHPTFEVLTLSYNLFDGQGVRRWRPGEPAPAPLFFAVQRGGLVAGWNSAGFEYKAWNLHLVPRFGWPPLPLEQVRDTMADARAWALPGALAKAAEVLGTAQQKDKDGKRLLDKFSIPRNPTKANPSRRIRPEDDPEDFERLRAYCDQDVLTESAIAALVPPLSSGELEVWQTDRRINDRGVCVDQAGIACCIEIIEQAHEQYNVELRVVTGGAVEQASQLARLVEWCNAQGVAATSLDEERLAELLAGELPPHVRRALEIRAAIGSAAVKKTYAMRNMLGGDGRLHDLYHYHAARTGRVTGDGPQPTNMPNSAGVYAVECEGCGEWYGEHRQDCPHCGTSRDLAHRTEWCAEAAESALRAIYTCSLGWIEHVWGDAMRVVCDCLRALFVAIFGHDLICSDYSAIEAAVLAELAGEEWRREVFRTHGKIYEMSGAKVMGLTLEEVLEYKKATGNHHPCRKKGKINELALGYQGWVGALKAFGAPGTDDELKADVLAWREASPAIVEFWGGQQRGYRPELYGVEGAFIYACQNPGAEAWVRGLRLQKRGNAVYLRLLSGRELTYHNPVLSPSSRRAGTLSISYEGNNTNPKNGPVGWIRMETWGGRLVENIVQATARDIQWHGIIALERAGYPIVLHVYDENVAEVPEGFGSVEEFERIMSTMPEWAAGWPVVARGGWRGRRYRK